jgi:transcription-repair coupling factor (superfamily II helicase)
MRIVELVQRQRSVKLAGNDKLRIERTIDDAAARAQLVRETLRALGPPRVAKAA